MMYLFVSAFEHNLMYFISYWVDDSHINWATFVVLQNVAATFCMSEVRINVIILTNQMTV